MFTRSEIAAELNRMVPVELYIDRAGDRNSDRNLKLLGTMLKTSAIPMYAVVDPVDEKLLGTFPGQTYDQKRFLAFLRTAQDGGAKIAREP